MASNKKGSPKKFSYGDALETQRALKKADWDRNATAKALGISQSTLIFRLRKIKDGFPQLVIEDSKNPGGRPKIERTAADDLKVKAAQESKRATEAKYKDLLTEFAVLQARIAELEYVQNAVLEPPDWMFQAPKGKALLSTHIPLLFFSDAQAGEVVRKEETDAPWDYNSEIFCQRYRHMVNVMLELSLTHQGRTWNYPGCIYARGGDNISGGLHEDLRELGEDITVLQQVELVAEEEIAGIRQMAEAFGKVTVVSTDDSNHGRNTPKPRSKLAWARSYDRTIRLLIAKEFKQDKRISFLSSKSPDIHFPIFDKQICMTHGDKTGAGGGMGFGGPAFPIVRGWHKVHMEQARLGYNNHMIMTGHYHYPMIIPQYGMSNGSFTGYTEYGKMLRFTPVPPMQLLTFWHSVYGCVDERHIYLAKPI